MVVKGLTVESHLDFVLVVVETDFVLIDVSDIFSCGMWNVNFYLND